MVKIKLIMFFVIALFAIEINAQAGGFLGLIGQLGGGGGGGGGGGLGGLLSGFLGGSVNVSARSAADNKTIAIMQQILKTPFTKAGFFRKLSLLQMLQANGGINKMLILGIGGGGGGATASTETTTTEGPDSKTPFPDTVFRPEENNNDDKSSSASLDTGSNVIQNGNSVNGNSLNGIRVNGNSVSSSSVNGNSVNGNSVNGVSINGNKVNGNSANGNGETSGSDTASKQVNGYQYNPSGPDRLTIPTNFISERATNRNLRSSSRDDNRITL